MEIDGSEETEVEELRYKSWKEEGMSASSKQRNKEARQRVNLVQFQLSE